MFALLFMFAGIALGYLLRETRAAAFFCRLVMPCILALLFCMGALIGNNRAIMDNLDTLGLQGLILAACTMTGSCIAVTIIVRLFFKDNKADRYPRSIAVPPDGSKPGEKA